MASKFFNIDAFTPTRSELEARLKWYNKKYGPVIQRRGLHNWKNLFRRPNIYEWTILFLLILALFMGWAYQRDFIVYEQNIQQHCCEICYTQLKEMDIIRERSVVSFGDFDLTLKEENSEEEEVT